MTVGPVVLDYYACDLRTGLILEELHSLTPSGAVGRRLGSSTTAQFDLDLSGAPAEWDPATMPGRTMLVAVDARVQLPVWAGLILTRAGGSDSKVQLGCATPEAYFDRRYTGTYTAATATDQATILTSLGTALTVNAPSFAFDAPATGTTQTYSVLDGDDRTILSCWQELMAAEGGPEWTIDPVWQDAAQTTIQLVIRIRPKIGTQSATPETVFDLPGCIASYTQTESYEAGQGATDVLAWGDGQGASRLHSSTYTATDLLAAGWPSWVYRFTPAAGLSDPAQLNLHAQQALALMRTGSSAWTLVAVASRSQRVGSDWGIGDSIRLQVAANTAPRHPLGLDMVARAVGWDLDAAANTITPILVEGA